MQIGIASIQRDRAPWLREWVAFHYLVGFRRFFLYLHKCADDSLAVVQGLRRHFDIKVIVVEPQTNRPQYAAYTHACENYLGKVDWMAFIDGDEFLFPVAGQTLEAVLEQAVAAGPLSALAVYWACFGSSGHVDEPAGLILDNYRRRGPLDMAVNRTVKSLVRGARAGVLVGEDPHVFRTPQGTFDELMRPVECGLSPHPPSHTRLRINHYATQSRSHYLRHKQMAELATGDAGERYPRPESWWQQMDRNDIPDDSVLHLMAPLRQLLAGL